MLARQVSRLSKMLRYQILNSLLHALVFFMGAGIGSFLNVVIYRLPREMSVNDPVRSFCPSCKKQIPMWQNIPVLSWLLLRGKCAACGAAISVRYILVEVLVGALFYAAFLRFGGDWSAIKMWGPTVLALWLFLALLVSGTFIDIEHFILPHEITIGGMVVGWVLAYVAPELLGEEDRSYAMLLSFSSSMLGLGLLWSIVELGKLAFGRVKHDFVEPEKWSITEPAEDGPPVMNLQEEVYPLDELFSRKTDRLILSCPSLKLNDRTWQDVRVEIKLDSVTVKNSPGKDKGEIFPLEQVKVIEGTAMQVVIPREAMGFGDVLFIAMIGAFCGWKGVLFAIFAASIIGTIFALVPRLLGKSEWSAKIPFGPYLAAGAAIWVFYGVEIVNWYLVRTGWNR